MKELQRTEQLTDGTIAASPSYRALLQECCAAFDDLLRREAKAGRKTTNGKRAVHIACGKRKTRKCA